MIYLLLLVIGFSFLTPIPYMILNPQKKPTADEINNQYFNGKNGKECVKKNCPYLELKKGAEIKYRGGHTGKYRYYYRCTRHSCIEEDNKWLYLLQIIKVV